MTRLKVPATATIAAFGDLAYEDGRPSEFQCFNDPASWGFFKSRMAPSIGNHDARDTADPNGSTDADAYFDYFIDQAPAPAFGPGARGQGWYTYNLETWKIIVLNSACNGTPEDFCDHDAQLAFLQAQLQNSPRCTLIYLHHTIISSKAPIIDHGGGGGGRGRRRKEEGGRRGGAGLGRGLTLESPTLISSSLTHPSLCSTSRRLDKLTPLRYIFG